MLNAKPLGIIDTLSEGFTSLNRHLWVLLLPIAVDVLLAFGPGLTGAAVVDQLFDHLAASMPAEAGADSQASGLVAGFREHREEWLQVNLLAILTLHLPSAVTVTAMVPRVSGPVLADVSGLGAWMAFMAATALAGLGIASVYLSGLAGCVRANPAGVSGLIAASSRTFGRLLMLYGMALFVGVPGFLVVAFVVTMVGLLAPIMASLLGTLFMAAFMLAAFYAAFIEEAIVLKGAWPVPAALASARVVYRHFWTTLGFIAISVLITVGVPVVWRLLTVNAVGMVTVIVAHAYLSSGLAVAAMLYFWQRQTSAAVVDTSTQSLGQGA
jgi:hypothetical protein